MYTINRPSEKVLARYIEAVKREFPEIEIDSRGVDLAVVKIQGVAAETAGEFVARLYFKFDFDKMTTLSILPSVSQEVTEHHECKPAAESGRVSDENGAVSIRPEDVDMAKKVMSIPKVLVCIEAVANELLENGTIDHPVDWITKKYPEILGLSQRLQELENNFGSKPKSSKNK